MLLWRIKYKNNPELSLKPSVVWKSTYRLINFTILLYQTSEKLAEYTCIDLALTLLHSEWPKLHRVLAILGALRWKSIQGHAAYRYCVFVSLAFLKSAWYYCLGKLCISWRGCAKAGHSIFCRCLTQGSVSVHIMLFKLVQAHVTLFHNKIKAEKLVN